MSATSLSVTPGYQFSPGEELQYSTLNLLAQPVIGFTGQWGTAQLAPLSVTQAILALQAVAAPQCVTGGFTPDSTGAAPFAPGWLSNLYISQGARPVAGRTKCVATNATSATAFSTHVAACTATELALNDATGNYYLATGVSVSADIAASGLNGLDTGVAGNHWYYLWVIYNGTTVAAVLSLSATLAGVTLPAGYAYGQIAGAFYSTSTGSSLIASRTVNRRVWMPAQQAASAGALTTGWVALAVNVPAIATVAYGNFKVSSAFLASVAGDGNGIGGDTFAEVNTGTFAVPIYTAGNVYVIGSSASGTLNLTVTGFEF